MTLAEKRSFVAWLRVLAVGLVLAGSVSLGALRAATTLEPTAEGLWIRAKAYRERLVFIIFENGRSQAAKAPLKITSRSVTFTDANSGRLFLVQLSEVNMPATLHVNNDLIPQALWMDEEMFALKDLRIRPLTPEETERLHAQLRADVEEAKENYREAYTGAACGGKVGVAAELCAMNAVATADRQIRVIEARAEAEARE